MPGLMWFSDQEIRDLSAVLKRIENKIDKLILSAANELERDMAEQDEINNLKAEVTRNTNVVSSASTALQGFMQQVSDLTKQLQDAVASDNSAAIKEATDALAANNTALLAAIPLVAQAVGANIK